MMEPVSSAVNADSGSCDTLGARRESAPKTARSADAGGKTLLVDWLIRSARKRPYYHLSDYMRRWWLIRPIILPFWPFYLSARVHKILRSDADGPMHDHPHSSVSIILRGRYYEIMPRSQRQSPTLDCCPGQFKKQLRRRGNIVFRTARDRHRLELAEGEVCYSLFIMFGPGRLWGFHTPDGWRNWREYLELEDGIPAPGESVRPRP